MNSWTLTWLEINTIIVVLTTLIFIGKFFCVGICVSIYDSTVKKSWTDEGRSFMWGFYWCSLPCLTAAWLFYFNEVPPGYLISSGLTTICLTVTTMIILCYWISRNVAPSLRRFHRELKNKKGLE